ncbi:MAG: histidyl-tRNA synthetase [Candidatus Azotimanducaceae bacterium]|jgi:histidyl-tRNA synthetase
MQDLLPERKRLFRMVEDAAREVFGSYGYEEIGLPILESTQLFKRTVGEATDIVEKEMYTFADRNDESITLRPEGTASAVRLAEQNGLLFNQVQRLWYAGPMFRYERPQKGRYRQFEQIGLECFGMAGPDIDAEVILLTARLWQKLGIDATLELNSLGSSEARATYRGVLVAYLNERKEQLDEDSQRRIDTNPMRVLDSKVPATRALLEDVPLLIDYLDNESKADFESLRGYLDGFGVEYIINPFIVRGLDYYNKTVFEWTTDSLGAQGTICAGGRYDGLVEQVGGKPTPGVGFAMGIDRLALMLENVTTPVGAADIYIASIGDAARSRALEVGEAVRTALPHVKTVVHCGSGKFKAQFKKADAHAARVTLVIGEDEVANDEVGVKYLRENTEQTSVKTAELTNHLLQYFS